VIGIALGREEREVRFVIADFRGERSVLVRADVRRIRDQEVELRTRGLDERARRVRLDERHVRGEAFGVLARDFERRGRHVGGEDGRARELARERHRETAAARAEVADDERLAPRARERTRVIDDQLGFRTRDQDRGVHLETAAVELAASDDVGGRLALRAPHEEVAGAHDFRFGHRPLEIEEEVQPIESERVRDQELGL
jgi:hypothetical protein